MENFRKQRDGFLLRHRRKEKMDNIKPFTESLNLLGKKMRVIDPNYMEEHRNSKKVESKEFPTTPVEIIPPRFHCTNSIKSIMSSPLGRCHLSQYIEREAPHLMRLLDFRIKYATLQIDMENKPSEEVAIARKQLQEDFLTPNGTLSVLSLLAKSKEDWEKMTDFSSVDELIVRKLQQLVYSDFIQSEEGRILVQRLVSLREHYSLRRMQTSSTDDIEIPKGVHMDGDEIRGILEVKKRKTSIRSRNQWKRRHVITRGNVLFIYDESGLDLQKLNKLKVISLLHANVIECQEKSNLYDLRLDVQAWSKKHQCLEKPRSFYLRMESQAHLQFWWEMLSKRTHECTKIFQEKNTYMRKKILSYFDLRKEIGKALIDTMREFRDKKTSEICIITGEMFTSRENHPQQQISQHHQQIPHQQIPLQQISLQLPQQQLLLLLPQKQQSWQFTLVGIFWKHFLCKTNSNGRCLLRMTKEMFYARTFFLFHTLYLSTFINSNNNYLQHHLNTISIFDINSLNNTFSFSWIAAIAGIWAYTDYLFDHKIIMELYIQHLLLLCFLSFCFVYILKSYSWFLFVLFPLSMLIGHNEFINQTWAQKHWEEEKGKESAKESKDSKAEGKELEWVNRTLEGIWPNLKRTTEDSIKLYGQQILDENCPSFLSSIDILNLSFGKPPSVVGVFVRSSRDQEQGNIVSMDIDIEWFDCPEISLRVVSKAAGVSTQVELMELQVSGSLRVEFILDGWEKDIPLWPCFSALSYAFTKKPEINFRLRTMKVDVMNVPLLSNWLYSLITTRIASHFTYPHCITAPDWRYQTENVISSDSFLIPHGILAVKILKVHHMVKFDKFHNVYCEVTLDGEYRKQHFRSRKISDSVSMPEWNETFFFLIDDPLVQALTIQIFSTKTIGKDIPLLEYVHAVHLMNDKSFQTLELPLEDKCQGYLSVDLTWKKVQETPHSLMDSSGHSTNGSLSSSLSLGSSLSLSLSSSSLPLFCPVPTLPKCDTTLPFAKTTSGILIITLFNAEGIRPFQNSFHSNHHHHHNTNTHYHNQGLSYVCFSLGYTNSGKQGFCRSKDSNDLTQPEWNQNFYFIVDHVEKQALEVQLFKKLHSGGKTPLHSALNDELLGQENIDLSFVVKENQDRLWKLPLETPLANCMNNSIVYLNMKMHWRFLE